MYLDLTYTFENILILKSIILEYICIEMSKICLFSSFPAIDKLYNKSFTV